MSKSKIYDRYSLFPKEAWVWPNFKPKEIACKDGSLMIDTEAMDKLQALRERIGRPLVITSGYRSPAHNAKVGGAPRSRHMMGLAFDIIVAGHDPHEMEAEAREVGFHGIGRYPDKGFLHVDARPEAEAATWGPSWPFGEDDPKPRPAPAPKDAGIGGQIMTAVKDAALEAVAGEVIETVQRKVRLPGGGFLRTLFKF